MIEKTVLDYLSETLSPVPVLMELPERGWASGYISCAEAVRIENEQSWYCYFSANVKDSLLPFPSKGGLGLLLGHDNEKE